MGNAIGTRPTTFGPEANEGQSGEASGRRAEPRPVFFNELAPRFQGSPRRQVLRRGPTRFFAESPQNQTKATPMLTARFEPLRASNPKV